MSLDGLGSPIGNISLDEILEISRVKVIKGGLRIQLLANHYAKLHY